MSPVRCESRSVSKSKVSLICAFACETKKRELLPLGTALPKPNAESATSISVSVEEKGNSASSAKKRWEAGGRIEDVSLRPLAYPIGEEKAAVQVGISEERYSSASSDHQNAVIFSSSSWKGPVRNF
eukprot:scaffold3581_cov252-Pinguiococcus_pyrenoidosus.AAC.1